ncbi:universal stress protein [Streptomyces sp. NBC_00140]|uniref:universal stress protein n=1 Tax=Streptomyces sp. NBC_00140 TaxID=2975664 RepID=UPI002252B8BA|nr:universal stress protein [Streptomyces sp. NBC_00140]MCX5336697.1 universal stress protein [Streptomyces sp. NBC_00140]
MERVIIAGVDRSARSRSAADWAAREALLRGLPLRVVHVSPSRGPDPARQWPYRPETVADRAVAELAERHPVLSALGMALDGPPVLGLRAQAEDAELLVLGLRGEGGHAGVAVGSTASALAAECARPVVLVPGTSAGRWRPSRADGVVLGIEARDPADGPLGFAFEAARTRGARLHAVHCWTLPAQAARSPLPVLEEDRAAWEDEQVQALSDALRPWRGKYPDVDVLEDVRLLPPAEALTHTSGNAELVVAGQGATALALLRHAQCPVAVVPS